MHFLLCSLTNRPTNDALLNRRNGLTYDRAALETLLLETKTCPISQIDLRRSDFLPLRPEQSKDEFIYGNGSLPFSELMVKDLAGFLIEKKNVREQIEVLSNSLLNELAEKQANAQLASELLSEIGARKAQIEASKVILDRQEKGRYSEAFRQTLKQIYSNLLEINKAKRRNLKINEKELLWKLKTFSVEKFAYPRKIRKLFVSTEERFCLLSDEIDSIVLLDIVKTCVLDVSDYSSSAESILNCFLLEHLAGLKLLFLHRNEIAEYFFDNGKKKLESRSRFPLAISSDVIEWQIHPSLSFLIGKKEKEVVFIELSTLGPKARFSFEHRINKFCVHPDGKLIILNLDGASDKVEFFDLFENKIMSSFISGNKKIIDLIFSADRFNFAIKGQEKSQIVDIRKLEAVYEFESAGCSVLKFNFSGSLLGALFQDRLEIHLTKLRQVIAIVPLKDFHPIDFVFDRDKNCVKLFCAEIILVINFIE